MGYELSKFLHSFLIIPILVFASRYRLMHLPIDGAVSAVTLLLVSEFFYYWYHRVAHEFRGVWNTHAVHHSSPVMNFAAAFRLPWMGWFYTALMFNLPLVLLGFSPFAALTTWNLNLFFQFWLHTELVPPMPSLERIFNTPALHRVHHARNPLYLDKNYGGVLSIYDHLFGTFQAELADEPADYGLIGGNDDAMNPVSLALGELVKLARDVAQGPTWRVRLLTLIRPPGWRPDGASNTTADLLRHFRAQGPTCARLAAEIASPPIALRTLGVGPARKKG